MKKTRSSVAIVGVFLFTLLALTFALPTRAQTNLSLLSDVRIADVGVVHAIAVQPDGRIIIGGDFRWVNDVTRNHLARLWPDGSLDLTWNPDVNDRVDVLLIDGTNLYVGGHFTSIGTNNHSRIARINLAGTGAADTNWNVGADGTVRALLSDGSHLFVGGSFSNFSGLPRTNLARVAVTDTGTVDPAWTPSTSESVRALAADATHVFVGGQFTNVSGTNRTYVAKLDRVTGTVDPDWNPVVISQSITAASPQNSAVCSLAIDGTNLYMGGYLTNVSGLTRKGGAKLSTMFTGQVDVAWSPFANQVGFHSIQQLVVSSTNLYIAGSWNQFPIIRIGRLSLVDAAVDTGWPTTASSELRSLAVAGTNVYFGGQLFSAASPAFPVFGISRFNITSATGDTNFATRVLRPGSLRAIVNLPDASTVLGGDFRFADNHVRSNLVKITSSGSVDALFAPQPNASVKAIISDGAYLYFGGDFTRASGLPRTNLFRTPIDSLTGEPDAAWTPRPGGAPSPTFVESLALDNTWLYVGGRFSGLAGNTNENTFINSLGRISRTNGIASIDFNWGLSEFPASPTPVDDLLVTSNRIFFSRERWSSAGGFLRHLTNFYFSIPFNNSGVSLSPYPNLRVNDMVSDGTYLYVGGQFTKWIGATNYDQAYLARVTLHTRTFDPTWTPSVNGEVTSLALIGPDLVINGLFTTVNGEHRSGLAKLTAVTGELVNQPSAFISGGGYFPFAKGGIYSTGGVFWAGNLGESRPVAHTLVADGPRLLVGGEFHYVNGRRRDGFAIIDTTPSPVTTFTNWQTNFFSGPALADTNISGPLADAEGDSTQNLMEFALLLDPTLNDATPIASPLGTNGLPTLRVENFGTESRLVVEYVRRRPEHQPGIEYTVEFAPHPSGPWQPGGVENLAFVPAPLERVIVVDSVPASVTNVTRYARLRVTQR